MASSIGKVAIEVQLVDTNDIKTIMVDEAFNSKGKFSYDPTSSLLSLRMFCSSRKLCLSVSHAASFVRSMPLPTIKME